ncbi:unnamed protein product [Paramecium octaurelia]|uniref:Uncharacterized protein n=1 Tax=Paramecium octaurelia TaxID=43137 RepID=A0A8S1W9P6_PAROT|nr:unnamed protein product [Paramecium octaurelia]CAD8184605.1 unnamed protein product [Paramecium octaurelia]
MMNSNQEYERLEQFSQKRINQPRRLISKTLSMGIDQVLNRNKRRIKETFLLSTMNTVSSLIITKNQSQFYSLLFEFPRQIGLCVLNKQTHLNEMNRMVETCKKIEKWIQSQF